ncbi:MAG: histidine phosphatase family protein [Deltaproteobacteria bacterium]|nr:histidine phosphatase family protein [Deltaproteobacteria bacterium]
MKSMSSRHCFTIMSGRSTRGAADRFCGWTDPPLSEDGRAQVMARRVELSREVRKLPAIWYVSDRRRAIETFEVLTAGTQVPILRIADKLREINFGVYENLTWEELPDEFQRQYELALTDPLRLTFPEGESFRDMCERVSALALDILSYQDDESDVGVIGHQGSVRLWHLMAEELPPEQFFADTPDLGQGKWITISASQVAQWRHRHLSTMTAG